LIERTQYPYFIGAPRLAINLNLVTHARREGEDRIRIFFASSFLNEHGLACVVLQGEHAQAVSGELGLDMEEV
jgi:hypothetical protein